MNMVLSPDIVLEDIIYEKCCMTDDGMGCDKLDGTSLILEESPVILHIKTDNIY